MMLSLTNNYAECVQKKQDHMQHKGPVWAWYGYKI